MPLNKEEKKSEINDIIAHKMKIIRKINGLNLEEVGVILNVSAQQVQKYETGATQIPFSKLFLFVNAFQLSPNFFFQA